MGIEVKFYKEVADELLEFAVVIARYQDKWIYCKHKERDTFEVPGGHREKGENIFDTAERELYEETGALVFKLKKMGAYSVVREDLESFGMLYFANIECFGALPDSEMEKVILCDKIPEALTYPLIQPKLVEFVQRKLREEFLFLEEIPLNKQAIIKGEKVLLLSFIKDNEEKKLLVLYKKEQLEEEEYYGREFQTNREEQLARIKCHKGFRRLGIQSMNIQGQQVILKSSSARGLSYYKEQDYQLYTYLKEKGFIIGEWLNCSMEQLVLEEYGLAKNETLPTIHLNEDLEMTLQIGRKSKLVDVQHPFKVSIGKVDTNTKIHYFDEATKEERFFYPNEVEKCYYYDEGIQRLEELLKQVAEEDKETFKQEYIKDLEEICPSGKAVVLLYYETEDGGQLNFLLKDYLEDVPIHNLENGIMYDYKVSLMCKGKGVNDYPLRVEILKTVEKDFDETLEIELFSRYIEIPEENIKIL